MANGNNKNVTARIGTSFSKEIEEVKELRIKSGLDKFKISTRELTDLLIKHMLWNKIKSEMINFQFKNKKAMSTIGIFTFIMFSIIIVILLGINFFIFNTVTTQLSTDIEIGAVNLENITDSTLGRLNTGFKDTVDYFGLAFLLGMILLMMGNAYFIGQRNHKLFIILDIFLLIGCFILAVYVSQVYYTYITSFSTIDENNPDLNADIYINELKNSSKIMLNLPGIVATLGVLIMIFSYLIIPKEQDNLQGVDVYGY